MLPNVLHINLTFTRSLGSIFYNSCTFLQELGVETKDSDPAGSLLEQEGPELLCGGCLWDPKHDYEQLEALCSARRSTCELKFEKVK